MRISLVAAAPVDVDFGDVEGLEADDMTRIQTTVQELSEVLQRLGASMYEQPETPPPGDAEGGPPPDDEDVVEGEFSEA